MEPGDLLFLTEPYNEYVHKRNPGLKINLTNRLAKLEEIIDWESEKGKIIKKAREDSGKWTGLSIEDCKYIVSIYHYDLTGRKGQKGVAERGVPLFTNDPETGRPFFMKVPEWIYKDIMKKCENFSVALKKGELDVDR